MIPANFVVKRDHVPLGPKKAVKLQEMPSVLLLHIVCNHFIRDNPYRWFHGKMSRDEAEKKLDISKDGLFLVRESNNFPGDYTLCVR